MSRRALRTLEGAVAQIPGKLHASGARCRDPVAVRERILCARVRHGDSCIDDSGSATTRIPFNVRWRWRPFVKDPYARLGLPNARFGRLRRGSVA